MQSLKQFFLFCSGANFSILKRTPTEYNKYVGIGATIFFTGVFAAIAAGYALSTVFEKDLRVLVPKLERRSSNQEPKDNIHVHVAVSVQMGSKNLRFFSGIGTIWRENPV